MHWQVVVAPVVDVALLFVRLYVMERKKKVLLAAVVYPLHLSPTLPIAQKTVIRDYPDQP